MKLTLAAIALILAAACGGNFTDGEQPGPDGATATGGTGAGTGESLVTGADNGPDLYSIGYTYGKSSGNRYLVGTGELGTDRQSKPVRIGVPEEIDSPAWLTAAPHPGGGAVWVVTGLNGKSVAYRIGQDGKSTEIPIGHSLEDFSLVPPVLVVEKSGQVGLTTTREVNGLSTLLPNTMIEFIDDESGNGDLRITRDGVSSVTSLRNAPDATFIIGDDSILFSYADSTDRYPHGAIGDKNEWGGMWMIPVDDGNGASHPLLGEGEVFEGLYPILADFDGDGVQEAIGTVSARDRGAKLIVMKRVETALKVVGVSEPIGTTFRWTHQVAVAPFGPDGEMELASIKTPHIGGVAEFYRLANGKLELAASLAGDYSSHVNGSRNLDMALAADFDGDGNVELLVPSRDRQSLVALRRTARSVEEVWSLPLGSPLATNLAGVELRGGSGVTIGLGVVTADGELFVWQ